MSIVAIGKIGKSIQFNRGRWGTATGGQMEPPYIFSTIANLNPQNTYVLVGRSDYSRLKKEQIDEWFEHNNIIDLWEGYNSKKHNNETYAYDKALQLNLKFDYGLFISGNAGGCSLKNKIYKRTNENEFAKPLMSVNNYAGPITHFLNETKIPWISLAPDDKFIPAKMNDLLNVEKHILAYSNKEFKVKRLESFENKDKYIEYNVKSVYSGIEASILLDKKIPRYDGREKTKKMVIFHNQAGGLNKLPILKDYFFDNDLEVEIYGTWDEEVYKSNDSFKGPLRYEKLQEMLPSIKYTFIIPARKDVRSMKLWECLQHGIIPFLHKDYDSSRIYTDLGFPDILRIESPEDLKQTIKLLEENEDLYRNIFNDLQKMLKPEYYTGEHLNKQINKTLKMLEV